MIPIGVIGLEEHSILESNYTEVLQMHANPTSSKYELWYENQSNRNQAKCKVIFNVSIQAGYLHQWNEGTTTRFPDWWQYADSTSEKQEVFATYCFTHFVMPTIECENDRRFLTGEIQTDMVYRPQYIVDLGSLWFSLQVGRLHIKQGTPREYHQVILANHAGKFDEEFPCGLFVQAIHRPSRSYGGLLVVTQGLPYTRRKTLATSDQFYNNYAPPTAQDLFYWMDEAEAEKESERLGFSYLFQRPYYS